MPRRSNRGARSVSPGMPVWGHDLTPPSHLRPRVRHRRVGHPGRGRQGQGAAGGRAARDRVRRGRARLPHPGYIVEAAQRACAEPRFHKYTPPPGCRNCGRRSRPRPPATPATRSSASQVLITNGGKQAVYEAFATLLDPGDEVLLPTPYWTTYPEAIALARRRAGAGHDRRGGPATARQRPTSRRPAPAAPSCWSSSPRPTRPGRSTRRSRSRRSGGGRPSAACGWSPTRSTSTWSTATRRFASIPVAAPEIADRCVVLNGVAKTYAMTGWRVGWMIGPADVDQGGREPAVATPPPTSATSPRRPR